MKRLFFFSILLCMICSCAQKTEITSPNGRIAVKFAQDENGRSLYSVCYDGQELISPSYLGIETKETAFISAEVKSVEHSSKNEEWTQPWGENKVIVNNYNEMAVNLTTADASALTLRFRAYNDGVAFRYELSSPVSDSLAVTEELTEFNFAKDGTSWSIVGTFETYELPYRVQSIAKSGASNTPYTFCVDAADSKKIYGSIHEAALYDYPEMILRNVDSLKYNSWLAPLPDGVKAYIPSTFTTPWRSIQLGDKAVDLINSSMILNLNEPSKIADASWIKPQKYVGVWWGMHLGTQVWTIGPRHGATTENAIKHIDFAAANNIQGVLFEGWNKGWETGSDTRKSIMLRLIRSLIWNIAHNMQKKRASNYGCTTRQAEIFLITKRIWRRPSQDIKNSASTL